MTFSLFMALLFQSYSKEVATFGNTRPEALPAGKPRTKAPMPTGKSYLANFILSLFTETLFREQTILLLQHLSQASTGVHQKKNH